MKQLVSMIALAAGLALLPASSRAQDAPPAAGCGIATNALVSQEPGAITIACSGISEPAGAQLVEIVNRIVGNRLDPQAVLVKLDEVAPLPEEGVARTLDENQRQILLRELVGKDSGQIAIIAHPTVADSGEYAKSIATTLLMAGWQIEGHQIRRAAPKKLEPVAGLALAVRDPAAPPQNALRLKAALTAARVPVPVVHDPALSAEAVTLWIGRRPALFGVATGSPPPPPGAPSALVPGIPGFPAAGSGTDRSGR